ncbi:ANTAR domain-containing protein [Mycolicibacterium duvalii]|nr:ANTAR domain-containing protein [Mycolicibacterium duvalii]
MITVDAVQAFELLKRLSQESNTTLVDVARLLIETDHPREEDD